MHGHGDQRARDLLELLFPEPREQGSDEGSPPPLVEGELGSRWFFLSQRPGP